MYEISIGICLPLPDMRYHRVNSVEPSHFQHSFKPDHVQQVDSTHFNESQLDSHNSMRS